MICLAGVVGVLPAAAKDSGKLLLVKSGSPIVCIVAGTGSMDGDAAKELAKYVEKISGAKLPVVQEGQEGGKPAVYVGNTRAAVSIVAQLTDSNVGFDGYIIAPVNGGLALVGRGEGTWYAVYDLLYGIGCRFFMPGDDCEYIPSAKDLCVPLAKRVERPALMGRRFQFSANLDQVAGPFSSGTDWLRKIRIGGVAFDHGHALGRHLPADVYFKDHPEYFALVGGKRLATQPCTSNPDVIKIITESVKRDLATGAKSASLSLNDTNEFCECDACLRERGEGFDASVNLLILANKVARAIKDEYPDRYLCFYASYDATGKLPKDIRVEPNLIPVLFPLANGHTIDDPKCPAMRKTLALFRDWKARGAKQLGVYDYLNNAEMECPSIRSMASVMRIFPKYGGIFWNYEVINRSWINNMQMYIAARLMWNPRENVEALVTDYCDKFYGKSGPSMRAYWERLEGLTEHRNPDLHGPEALVDQATPQEMKACEADLQSALKSAENELIRKRIEVAIANFNQDELTIAMEKAKAKLTVENTEKNREAVRSANAVLADYRKTVESLELTRPLRSIYAATLGEPTADYTRIAKLPEFWKFIQDKDNAGESKGWYNTDFDDSAWESLSTMDWWENQGFPNYDGYACYRIRFSIPKEAVSRKRLFLYFGAVDDHAWVYINGKLAGSHALGGLYWNEPFAIRIDPLVDREKENLLAVRVYDMAGMGGVFKPVWIVAQDD